MEMARFVRRAGVTVRARVGICGIDGNCVLVDVIAVEAMKVTIMEVIDVTGVLDGKVVAVAVNVVVRSVRRVGIRHIKVFRERR
jgi:hypothetical protein